MAMNVVLTMLCVVAVAFYTRFLLALLKECKFNWICYLLRLQENRNVYELPKRQEVETSLPRAA